MSSRNESSWGMIRVNTSLTVESSVSIRSMILGIIPNNCFTFNPCPSDFSGLCKSQRSLSNPTNNKYSSSASLFSASILISEEFLALTI